MLYVCKFGGPGFDFRLEQGLFRVLRSIDPEILYRVGKCDFILGVFATWSWKVLLNSIQIFRKICWPILILRLSVGFFKTHRHCLQATLGVS